MKFCLRAALAAALMLALAPPANAQQLWKWSKTSASNSNADPSINWTTGMAPSAVSPSARAMMAGIAKYRDDIAGATLTGGTTTAYTLATSSSIAATPNNGQLVAFTVHDTNLDSPTLSVDGGTAFAIHSAFGTNVPAGSLVGGSPYMARFSAPFNSWDLIGFYGNSYNIPLGGLMVYLGATPPNSNFAMPTGQCISRTTYSSLFSLIGTRYGSCDGTTTFALPDLQARTVVGLDGMNGATPSGRITVAGGNFDATVNGAAGGAQNHTLSTSELPVITPAGTISQITPAGTISAVTPSGTISAVTPSGTISAVTPSGTISAITPSGTISAVTPSGTISKPTITVTVNNGTNVAAFGTSATTVGAGGLQITPATITATASLDSNPVFTGSPSTPTFSGSPSTPTFTGSPSTPPTFTGSPTTPTFTGSPSTPTFSGSPSTPTFTGASFGSGGSHSTLTPAMALPMILRIF